MKIIIAEHFGMCFGVRDAIAEAERRAAEGPLTILGELVHNPVVRERLRALGIQEGALVQAEGATTGRVMITAHGAADAARAAWRSAGFQVADGTCPLVRYAHRQLQSFVQLGYFPLVIGKRGHVEVDGLIGDFPRALVIENLADISQLPQSETRFGVISQTTQPIERVRAIVERLRVARPDAEVKFCDTVCQPTKNRQEALQKLIASCDTIVVVGGRNSNNTLQLVEKSRAAGRRVVHVERAEELQPEWFVDAKSVGVTAGTSTLKETVEAVRCRLVSFAARARGVNR